MLASIGIQQLGALLPFEENYISPDVWILVVLGMCVFSFLSNSKQVTINSDGILCKSRINKKFIKWSDIKDWGLSYCGQTRIEGNTYYLYFSEHECKVKNECRKNLKGKMIKTFVVGNEYFDAVDKVIPFCKDKTEIKPFIGKDKHHFL